MRGGPTSGGPGQLESRCCAGRTPTPFGVASSWPASGQRAGKERAKSGQERAARAARNPERRCVAGNSCGETGVLGPGLRRARQD